MTDYYIPGLGCVEVKWRSGGRTEIIVEAYLTELELLKPQKITHLENCGECGKANDCLEGDYLCIECREHQGDVHFDLDVDKLRELS